MRRVLLLALIFAADAGAQEVELLECRALEEALSCPVHNSSSRAFGSFLYSIVASENGRSFPWGEIAGKREIPGGLEPGETIQEEFPLPTLPERAKGREIRYQAFATPLPQLTVDSVRLSRCWNVGSLSTDALRETIVVSFNVDENGSLDASSIRLSLETSKNPATNEAYEAVRRAIIRCGAEGALVGGTLEFSPSGIRKID